MDRQAATLHGSKEGHDVRSTFHPPPPVTPTTPRSSTPPSSTFKTLFGFTSTSTSVATPDESPRPRATMNQPRTYPPPPPLQSSVTPSNSFSTPGFGPSAPINVPQSKWDISQPPMSPIMNKAHVHLPPPSTGPSSDPLALHHRSYSLDYGWQPHSQTAPQQGRPDTHDFFTPRMPVYDANTFGQLGPPPGVVNDFTTVAPLRGEANPWFPAQSTEPTRSTSKKGRGSKKADGKQPTFLIKLYDVLEQPEYQHVLRWDETGDLIVIERPEELCKTILPLVYRQSRFASFSRQLNIYGWMRKVNLRHVESGIVDPDASTWAHQTLRRDSTKEEVLAIKRRVPPRPSQAQKRMMNEGISSISSDSDSFHSPPDPYSNNILQGLDEARSISCFAPQHASQAGVPASIPQVSTSRSKDDAFIPTLGAEPLPSRRVSFPPAIRPGAMGTQRPGDGNRAATFPSYSGNQGGVMPGNLHQSSFPLDSMLSMPNKSLQFIQGGYQGDLTGSNASPPTSLSSLWIGDDQNNDDLLLRGNNEGPAYLLNDASTWARSGYGILGSGLRTSSPAPVNSSSLPSNFQSFYHNPAVPQPQPGNSTSHQTIAPISASTPAQRPAPLQPQQLHQQQQPQIVSPGVYQAGFNVNPSINPSNVNNSNSTAGWNSPVSTPSPPLANVPTTPPMFASRVPTSPTLTKAERRLSGSKPYSPPRSTDQAPKGIVRTVSGRRTSLSHISTSRSNNGDDEGLPSANLHCQPELFGGELDTNPSMNDSM